MAKLFQVVFKYILGFLLILFGDREPPKTFGAVEKASVMLGRLNKH